jgi:hypothetical protein
MKYCSNVILVYFSRLSAALLPVHYTTKQSASDVANEHIKNCHTPEQEINSTNNTVKPNTCITAAQTRLEKYPKQ